MRWLLTTSLGQLTAGLSVVFAGVVVWAVTGNHTDHTDPWADVMPDDDPPLVTEQELDATIARILDSARPHGGH